MTRLSLSWKKLVSKKILLTNRIYAVVQKTGCMQRVRVENYRGDEQLPASFKVRLKLYKERRVETLLFKQQYVSCVHIMTGLGVNTCSLGLWSCLCRAGPQVQKNKTYCTCDLFIVIDIILITYICSEANSRVTLCIDCYSVCRGELVLIQSCFRRYQVKNRTGNLRARGQSWCVKTCDTAV